MYAWGKKDFFQFFKGVCMCKGKTKTHQFFLSFFCTSHSKAGLANFYPQKSRKLSNISFALSNANTWDYDGDLQPFMEELCEKYLLRNRSNTLFWNESISKQAGGIVQPQVFTSHPPGTHSRVARVLVAMQKVVVVVVVTQQSIIFASRSMFSSCPFNWLNSYSMKGIFQQNYS